MTRLARSYIISHSQSYSYMTKLTIMILGHQSWFWVIDHDSGSSIMILGHWSWPRDLMQSWKCVNSRFDDLYKNNYEVTIFNMFVKSCHPSVEMPEYWMTICNLVHAICCLQVSGVHENTSECKLLWQILCFFLVKLPFTVDQGFRILPMLSRRLHSVKQILWVGK